MLSPLLLLIAIPLASALPAVHDTHDHSHHLNNPLPSTWYHPDDHPVHQLFKRAPGDGINYAPVGSPTWSSGFPQSTPDSSKLPAEWVDALNAAVAAGKIPNIPQSTNTPGVNPVYPTGSNPNSPEVCSATYKCRNPGDIWDAPTGTVGISFDDGPLPPTPKLLQFLQTNNQKATHFMIGVNILNNPQLFQTVFDSGDDIAVHTWTHPYMTTLSNLDVVAQLGWTSALIRNSTGGRVPRFWRPPYGDSDNRVRAIAKEVFGLQTIIWNQDTEDWSLTTGGTTLDKVHASLQQWYSGPKTPGLIILEHEISDQSVQAFMDGYPIAKANGWNTVSLATLVGGGNVYQNAANSSSTVSPGVIVAGQNPPTSPSTPSQSSSSSSSSSPNQSTHTDPQSPSGTSSGVTATNKSPNSAPRSSGTPWGSLFTAITLTITAFFTLT